MTSKDGFQIRYDGPVATLAIDNGPVNTVDPELIERLIDKLPAITEDPDVRCIVVRGKDKVFVGGADITVMRRLEPATYKAMRRWVEVQRALELAPKPVVAAINGHAIELEETAIGYCSVAVPVFGSSELLLGALSITAPTFRADTAKYAVALTEVMRKVAATKQIN